MKTNRIGSLGLMLSLAILTVACGTLELGLESAGDDSAQLVDDTAPPTEILPSADNQPIATEEDTATISATKRYEFKELGISLEVPADLYVKKDPRVKLDDPSKLEGYLFYIQNYGHPGGQSSGDFQMYGHIQFGTFPFYTVSWEEFSNNTLNSPMNAYANYIEIDGLRGYDTQLSGVRNRFVYQFHLDQHVLTIAVAAPTPENKALADQIISTLKVLPEGLSDASHVKLFTEPNSLYQLLIPEDWEYTFNPKPAINLSEFEAKSPDLEIVVEDGAGHSDIYYKQGVHMTLIVFEGDSDIGEPYRDVNRIQNAVYFNGIEGTEYFFVEPSTAEGKLRQVHVHYDRHNYVLRFGYSNDADTDAIDQIIANFQITPEEFYSSQ